MIESVNSEKNLYHTINNNLQTLVSWPSFILITYVFYVIAEIPMKFISFLSLYVIKYINTGFFGFLKN